MREEGGGEDDDDDDPRIEPNVDEYLGFFRMDDGDTNGYMPPQGVADVNRWSGSGIGGSLSDPGISHSG